MFFGYYKRGSGLVFILKKLKSQKFSPHKLVFHRKFEHLHEKNPYLTFSCTNLPIFIHIFYTY